MFVGVYCEDKEHFLYTVPNRTSETVFDTITTCIKPGTTIISDLWGAVQWGNQFKDDEFSSYDDQHCQNFIHPLSGAHKSLPHSKILQLSLPGSTHVPMSYRFNLYLFGQS